LKLHLTTRNLDQEARALKCTAVIEIKEMYDTKRCILRLFPAHARPFLLYPKRISIVKAQTNTYLYSSKTSVGSGRTASMSIFRA
jgi:hypothetical protein